MTHTAFPELKCFKGALIVSFALVLLQVIALNADGSEDSSADSSGNDGNIHWEYKSSTHTITISKRPDAESGEMKDYERYDWKWSKSAPWLDTLYSAKWCNVVVEEGVTSIGAYAFHTYDRFNVMSLELPGTLKTIRQYQFADNSNLRKLVIPDSVTSVYGGAFDDCEGLREVSFPITTAPQGFEGCKNVEKITFTKGSNGVGFNIDKKDMDIYLMYFSRYACKEVIFGEGVRSIGTFMLYQMIMIDTVVFPSTLETINRGFMENCTGLSELTIPDNVKKIQKYAFKNCSSLSHLSIPISLNAVSDTDSDHYPFAKCTNLREVVFTAGTGYGYQYNLKEIKGSPWYLSRNVLTGVTFDEGVKELSPYLCYGCTKLTSVTFSEGVETISNSSFEGCSELIRITLPHSLHNIEMNAFKDCSYLEEVKFGEIMVLGLHQFDNTNLQTLNLPESLTFMSETFPDLEFIDIVDGEIRVLDKDLQTLKGYSYDRYGTQMQRTYGVSLDPNGGSCDVEWIRSDMMTGTLDDLGKQLQVREGFTFAGWYTKHSGGVEVTDKTPIADLCTPGVVNLNLYARWTYVIPETVQVTPGQADLLIGDTVELSYFTYPVTAQPVLWTSDNPSVAYVNQYGKVKGVQPGTAHIQVMVMGIIGTATVTVVKDPVCTIFFDANGGRCDVEKMITNDKGYLQSLPQATMERHAFTGWWTDPAGGREITTSTHFSEDTTVYARWSDIPVEHIDISRGSITQSVGSSVFIMARIFPTNATETTIRWSSNNEDVATVDQEGKVTCVGAGKADVTASAGGKYATCKVFVLGQVTVIFDGNGGTPSAERQTTDYYGRLATLPTANRENMEFAGWWTKPEAGTEITTQSTFTKETTVYAHWTAIAVTGISIDPGSVTVYMNDRMTLTAVIEPQDATVRTVEWRSNDEKVVFVSSSGTIIALGKGTTTVTVTADDGGFSADCTITVLEAPQKYTVTFDGNGGTPKAESLQTDAEGHLLYIPGAIRQYYEFDAWYTQATGGEKISTIYTFTQNTTVYAHWKNIPVEGVSLSTDSINTAVGEFSTLVATITPETATDRGLTWYSADETVAIVTESGRIYAIAPGETTITVETHDGGYTASCTVTVTAVSKMFTITFDGNGGTSDIGSLQTGDDGRIHYLPDAYRERYAFAGWYTEQVLGEKVTLEKVYDADTTVYAHWDPIPVEKVIISDDSLSIVIGKSDRLQAKVIPEDATFPEITWSSDNEAVATVTSDGVVRSVSVGTAVITATAGDVSATCTVTVTDIPEEIIPELDETGTSAVMVDPSAVTEAIEHIGQSARNPYLNISMNANDTIVLPADVVTALYLNNGFFDTSSDAGYVYMNSDAALYLVIPSGDSSLRIRTVDINSDMNVIAAVDYSLLDAKGNYINTEFDNYVELGIKASIDTKYLDKYSVYYVPDEGEWVKIDIEGYENGWLYFLTDHFSTYVLVAEEQQEGSSHNILFAAIGILIVIAAIAAVAATVRKRN